MKYGRKLVLHYRGDPRTDRRLDEFVEQCLRDGVQLIAVAGENCSLVERAIDVRVMGDGAFIVTTAHQGEALEKVIEFARSFTCDDAGEVEVVEWPRTP